MSERAWIVTLALAFGGCCHANVNVVPKEANAAQVIATSSKESCATEKAQEEADQYCKSRGLHYIAVATDSKYQGADPNAKLAVGVMTGYRGDTSQDYRVQIDFRCE